MLKLDNLHIKRGNLTVANNLNLTLEKGKVYGILGPNGAGKSSLLNAIFGEIPFQGQIRFGDEIQQKRNLLHWRKRIGYMPQNTTVEASLSALDVVLLGKIDALHIHLSDQLLYEAVAIMEKLGIAHLAHQDITRLSGGQRQMVMFAQVLLRHPDILMLDEPVSALDIHHQINLLEHVVSYTQQHQLITLIVLHDLSLAAQFADALILLGEGELQGFGDAKKVLQPELISRLYHIEIDILYDRAGLPVIRPQRKLIA